MGEVPDEQLPGLISGALAFVYPTLYEGFGLPVLEAMQCGCPVITSRDPAVMEVSGGAAIHTSTLLEMTEGMISLARQPNLRERLAEGGRKRAGAFSWSRTASETRAIYKGLARA